MTQEKDSDDAVEYHHYHVAHITAPSTFSFNPLLTELSVRYTEYHPSLPNGLVKEVTFSKEGLRELIVALQKLGNHPDRPLAELEKPSRLQ